MTDGCPHHAHRHEAQRRLCDAVRRVRQWTRPCTTDPRVDALLAAVVRSHAADTHGDEAACDAAVRELDALCRALEGPQPAPRYVPPPEPPATPSAEAVEGPLVAYTDGSGTQGHLPSGAGVVVYDGDEVVLEASRHLGRGTNNHAELSAVRVALAITDAPGLRERELLVRSDSTYTIGALTAAEEPHPERANARLIALVRAAMEGRRVRFEHVRGHTGIVGNERADQLANLGRLRSAQRQLEVRSA